ncbi:MAG: dienelactone hydrolase family protein [Hyphomicrobiales bacterium]|nr:dienelactone hydrolase family protein [Hyphomicrobiales bacterium]
MSVSSSSSEARRLDLVIFLHGVGARGDDLAELGEVWRDDLPGVAFAAPDAPHPFDGAPFGRQWFSILGVTPENRGARIADAVSAFDAVVDLAIARAGTTAERTALVGFSQGSIMALDAIGRGRRFAGVVAYSGRLGRPPVGAPSKTPLLLIHGRDDEVIPFGESEIAARVFAEAGVQPGLHLLSGLGHGIDAAGVRLGGAFLAKIARGGEAS